MNNCNNNYCDNSVQLNIPRPASHSPNYSLSSLPIPTTSILSTTQKSQMHFKKHVYNTTTIGQDVLESEYVDNLNEGEHCDAVTESFQPHLDRDHNRESFLNQTHQQQFNPNMHCYDSISVPIQNDALDNREKTKSNNNFSIDTASTDTIASDLKVPINNDNRMSPSTNITSNKSDIQNNNNFKNLNRTNMYPINRQQHEVNPVPEHFYMDSVFTSNNCLDNLMHLKQKIQRQRQRLQHENNNTTKYFYDNHNNSKCNNSGTQTQTFLPDQYDTHEKSHQSFYRIDRFNQQNMFFNSEKFLDKSGTKNINQMEKYFMNDHCQRGIDGSVYDYRHDDPNYDKINSDASTVNSPEANVYGMIDFAHTDTLQNDVIATTSKAISNRNNINNSIDENCGTSVSFLLPKCRKVSCEASHTSNPPNETQSSECKNSQSPVYREQLLERQNATLYHDSLRKMSNYDKTLEKQTNSGHVKDDVEFMKL